MYSFRATLSTVIASASNVPSISTSVEMSKFAAVIVPVAVKLRKDETSLLVSTVTTFDAAIVPAVTPSIASKSFSLMSAEPMTKLPPVIAPVVVIALLVLIEPKPELIDPEAADKALADRPDK